MRAARVAALLSALLIAGCGTKPAPPSEPPKSAAPQAQTGTGPPAGPPVAPPSTPPVAPAPSAQAPVVATAPPIAAVPETRPTLPETPAPAPQAAEKTTGPAAKAPAKSAAPPATAAPPVKKEPPAATKEQPVATQAAPPLDLGSLETRLKDTKAIGVMTKLSLKNQVDDLLSQFRDFYAGKLKTTLAELRRPFDLLILKVLSLLQDSDPSLASAIASSREAIWGILSDREKFAKLAVN